MILERTNSAGYMTNWAARLFSRAIDKKLKSIGVSTGMLPVFFALSEGKALSQKKLAKLASIEQPTMAATLSRMERDGLIERHQDPQDGRSQLVMLTKKAAAKMQSIKQAVAAVNEIAVGQLSQAETASFMMTIQKITTTLETHLNDDD